MIEYSGTDADKFMGFYKIGAVSDLPKSHYEQAYNMLAKKIADMEAQTAQADKESPDVDL